MSSTTKRGRPTDAPPDAFGPSAGQRTRQEPDSEDSAHANAGSNSRWTPEQAQDSWGGDSYADTVIAVGRSTPQSAIAEMVQDRNHAQCLQRWNKVLCPGLIKGHWAFHEDDLLVKLVLESTSVNWADISKRIEGRTAKQCRERWKNHLDPAINKGPYKSEEDMVLSAAYKELGNRWTQIAERLPGRTEDSVKMRWKVLHPNAKSKAKPGRPPLMAHAKASGGTSDAASSVGDAPSSVSGLDELIDDDGGDDVGETLAPSMDSEAALLMSRRASSMLDSFKSRDSSLLSFTSVHAEDWEIFRELVLSDHFAQAMPTAPREMVSVFDSFTDKSMTDDEFRRLVGVIERPEAIMDFIHETYASMGDDAAATEWATCQCGCGGAASQCQDVDDVTDRLLSSFKMPEPTPFETYGHHSHVQETSSLHAHVLGADDDEDDDDDAMLTAFRVPKRKQG
ncbi:Aste57867_12036 [Aphanomyces stellatus]|uniref:Aste57867_12036 protein n=1 Tax=Aphanomyces stellatus TaxID=120398 RepID=A0A485KUI4_9STRA|nr:hypothetical protein As57867_011991 [Aphanomyces stellatus]VFT88891.1 Aste57867_12036 [Aphanomyces stellatus]